MERFWFNTCYSELPVSQKWAFWFIDLALTVKELLYVMPLTIACLFLHVAWLKGRMTKG